MNENQNGQNGYFPNNAGATPVQPVQQPMNQQPVQQPMMNQGMPQQQPMMNQGMPQPMGGTQPMYGGAPVPPVGGKKKLGTGAIIGIAAGAVVLGCILITVIGTKSLSCTSKYEYFDVEYESTYTFKTRFGKPYSMTISNTSDYSDSDYYDEDDLEDMYEEMDELCDDYDSGCSHSESLKGKVLKYSVTIKGDALEEFMDDEDIDDDDFADFDELEEEFKDSSDDATCK